MFYTLATAGHIDHGKSSLVRALTGINPDRLPEEQVREMTIDLGFAWFNLPDGSEVGIVDVPGHERFIRNMIAGVGGIDYVLFIVAADDGWMPQSQEHLEILNFLDHKNGAVIVTKTDLVEKDWLELVCEDIKSKLVGSFLEGAPLYRFSAEDNSGLDEIKVHLAEVLPQLPPRYNPQKPRLFTDRVFSMTGIGTVVTGTMRDGFFRMGDEVSIVPSGKTAKIKSIQTFKQARDEAFNGARAALSLTGISRENISRGDCLISPTDWTGTDTVAVKVKLSNLARIPLTHNRQVTVLIGTSELEATARMFKDDKLGPGEEGVCLLYFEQNCLARIGDRVILRYPTPDMLVGGGVITDVDLRQFIRKNKNMRKFYLERSVDNVSDLIISELRKYRTRREKNLLEASNFSVEEIRQSLEKLIAEGQVVRFAGTLITSEFKDKINTQILEYLESFHTKNPTRKGVSKSELISKLKLTAETVDFALDYLSKDKKIIRDDTLIGIAGHKTGLKPEQERIRGEILEKLSVTDYLTPSRREIENKLHVIREVLNYLVQSGEVIELAGGILYKAQDFQSFKEFIISQIKQNGSIEVKQIKDRFGLTRKYTIPILERLDKDGVTRREGDKRVLNADQP